MKSISKKVTIEWKLNPNLFKLANEENIEEPVRFLGSARNAVNSIISNGEMMRALMPNILGLDPQSTSSNWHKAVKNYWDSLSIGISSTGKVLEIGLEYDIESDLPHVKELKSKNSNINTDDDLIEWVTGKVKTKPNVPFEYRFRYATPIVMEDYLLYIYCQGYRDVANNMQDVDKSKAIRFYIADQDEIREKKRSQFALEEEADNKYAVIAKNKSKIDTMLYLYDADPDVFEDEIDKLRFLKQESKGNPQKFIRVANDKNLAIKAEIEKMVRKGVLNRLPNTQIIVDANDPDTIIGNTLQEAVSYFSSEAKTKVTKVKELKTQLDNLNN